MEDIIVGLVVAFIVGGLIGGINRFNSVGGFSTGKGRIGCLMSIIFPIGVFALMTLYDLFIYKDTETLLIFLILIAVCFILYRTTKMFPNFYSKKPELEKEKEIESNIAAKNINELTKLYDDGKISKKRLLDSIKRLKRKEERSK